MGLGTVKKSNTTYLVIAGGFIWNKKANRNDPNYATQEWTNAKGEVQERSGAQYGDLTGTVTNVYFKTHDQYGEALYVTLEDGGDSYTLNIKTNTANSQHMMKALLLCDLNKPLFVSPYDFVGKDKRRAQGISFKQDGQKIDLKKFVLPEEWKTNKDFWLPSNKKKYSRFLVDFSDWLISEIEEKIKPQLGTDDNGEKNNSVQEDKVNVREFVEEAVVQKNKITPLKMKKYLKEYISENYEGKGFPKLNKEELVVWYELATQMEELPFKIEVDEDLSESEVDEDDIQAQLDALAGM